MSEERPQVVDKRRFIGEKSTNIQEVGHADPLFISDGPVSVVGNPPDSLSYSPSSDPNKPSTMDFASAMRFVVEGKRVTRLSWDNPEIYLIMFMWGAINPKTPAGKYLSIHHADGAMNPLYINDGDLLGDDWVVIA